VRGDKGMTAEELQAAIALAEGKRHELEGRQPAAKASARMLAMLPRAAEEFRKQLALGLDGSERDVLRARVPLRRRCKRRKMRKSAGHSVQIRHSK
jgi:hypothetical protein